MQQRLPLHGAPGRPPFPYGLAILFLIIPLAATGQTDECYTNNVYVDQLLSNGHRQIVIEAEDASTWGPSSDPDHTDKVRWRERTDSRASGSAFAVVPTEGQDALDSDRPGARIDYSFEITGPGTYYLYLRHASPTTEDNGIWVALDGRVLPYPSHLSTGDAWRWEAYGDGFAINTAGRHTLSIFHRNDGTPLDKLIVSTEAGLTPAGSGPQATYKQPESYANSSTVYTENDQARVVLEAENSTNRVFGRQEYQCREWVNKNDVTASGDAYAIVEDAGFRSDSFDLRTAPRLDYEINFQHTGRYYVHLRHRGTQGNNSIWTEFNYADDDRFKIKNTGSTWRWETIGRDASFVVEEAGTQVFSILMREDGTPIDKIILSRDPNYRPQEEGPDATTEGIVYRQRQDKDHYRVDLPAERPSQNLPGQNTYADLAWETRSDADALGEQYAVVPATGHNTGTSDDGPDLQYTIDFITSGTHYLHLRHRSQPSGNSVQVYFDGRLIEDHLAMPIATSEEWLEHRMDQSFQVDEPGRHTFTISMREDGTELDHFTITTDPIGEEAFSMPVELVSFKADAQANGNHIEWTTSYEEDTEWHVLERSTDGRGAWDRIATLPAAGYSRDYTDYAVVDESAPTQAYYRLTTIDIDGSKSRSRVVAVIRKNAAARPVAAELYPNPATDVATLSFELDARGPVAINLFSTYGDHISTLTVDAVPGTNRLRIPVANLPNGTYIVAANIGDHPINHRLIVSH